MKRSPLKADPQKVRAWRERQRSALTRRVPRKRREPISAYVRREAFARSNRKCIVCKRRVQLEIHHVLPVRQWPELTADVRNLVGICSACHANHEAAARRVRWDELPPCAITLAQMTSGAAVVYMERTYPRC